MVLICLVICLGDMKGYTKLFQMDHYQIICSSESSSVYSLTFIISPGCTFLSNINVYSSKRVPPSIHFVVAELSPVVIGPIGRHTQSYGQFRSPVNETRMFLNCGGEAAMHQTPQRGLQTQTCCEVTC